jgi:curved DNA-binding protein CbpA
MEFRAFFVKCTCENDVKKVYRGLAMAHHPDKGGTPERFQILQEEYQYQLRKMAPGYTYAERKTTYTYGDETVDFADLLRKVKEQQERESRGYRASRKTAKKAKSANIFSKILGAAVSAVLLSMGIRVTIKF